jgi:hypothetical protein
VLGPQTHDLQNGDAHITGGDAHFNGDVNVQNNGLVMADGAITVEGTASGSLAVYTPDPLTGQPAIPDPLDALPLPPDMSSLSVKTDPCVDGPGKYGGRDLRGISCTLAPGLYVIAGAGAVWDLAGNSSTLLSGTGVTLFFTCGSPATPTSCTAPGQAGATIDNSGQGTLNLTAPTTGPLKGLTIVFDRQNNSTLRLTGNGAGNITGTIYAPKAHLLMSGNGCGNFNSLLVVDDIELNGTNACLNVTYSPGQNVERPRPIHLSQ